MAAQLIVTWGMVADRRWAVAVREATAGWVDPNLPGGALVFLLTLVPFVFISARLRPRDTGLDRERLVRGLVVTAALWAAMQLVLATLSLVDDGALQPARLWADPRAPRAPLAFLLAMLVVMTAVEEATFRGFVLPQLWLRLRGPARVRTWGAVVGSAALFALVHVPNRRLMMGLDGALLAANLAGLLVSGIFFAVLYLRTANLWVTGGIHALLNAPTPLVEPEVPTVVVLVPLVLALVVLWPRLPGGERRPLRAGTRIEVDGPG